MHAYEATTLWQSAFGGANLKTDVEKNARDELVVALRKLDDRISAILATIPDSCRSLTIHDISHVHQLWSVASEICGPDYKINQLEGFVLGAAFLVHDAGLTAAAYPGGIDALRKTSFYSDRVAALMRGENDIPLLADAIANAPTDIQEQALFETLRAIHATRAEKLLETAVSHPLTGATYSIFPDSDLFLDCGEIIGLVAASHHWPIAKVEAAFLELRTAPAKFPWWQIDAAKLACILRAADACAVDERRAKIMPFIITNPRGISRDHWTFQANLNPGSRRDEAMVFQSKRPFERAQMPAWWLAYDALNIADRELRDCDRVLRTRPGIPGLACLPVRRVDGAKDPARLQQLIRVNGWTPIDTSVRIDNPISLVKKLGGWHLYGGDYSAPLRELVQNAADTIRARRTRTNAFAKSSPYPGRVSISLQADISDEQVRKCTLNVADDGLGMPPDVLTGALLDFGRSFWGTEEAAIKYPGLTSDVNFRPTGRFGIGFYAIFMIANDVKILSRPWNAGLTDIMALHFQSGVQGRAELRNYNESEDGPFPLDKSTLVRAQVNNPNWLAQFAATSIHPKTVGATGDAQLFDALETTMRQLFFALDVECEVSINGNSAVLLNQPGILKKPAKVFAKFYNKVFSDGSPDSIFDETEIGLIDSIVDERGVPHSRGVVSASGGRAIHIGGFTVLRSHDSLIKGVTERIAGTASRSAGARIASQKKLREWGDSQLSKVARSNLSAATKHACIANLVNIDIDVSEHAMLADDGKSKPIKTIVDGLPKSTKIFVSVQNPRGPWPLSLTENSGLEFWQIRDLVKLKHDLRLGGPQFHQATRYNNILGPLDAPTNTNSGYGILISKLKQHGFRTKVSIPSLVILGIYNGPKGGRGNLLDPKLVKGRAVKRFGIVIRCNRK